MEMFDKAPLREKIISVAVRTGRAVPPRMLEEPPEVRQGLGLYMRAFFDLVGDRQNGGGRIPWVAVRAWCEANGLVGEDAEDIHFVVTKMDIFYLDWAHGKAKKKQEQLQQQRNKNDPKRVLSEDG